MGEVRKGKAMLSNTCVVRENMVWDLTDQRLERVGRSVSRTALYEKKASSLPNFLLNRFSAWMLARMARRFTDDAIWLRGIAQELRDREDAHVNCDLDRYEAELGPKLLEHKNDLRNIREGLLSLQFDDDKAQSARNALLAALADLFESVESLRWSILESLADNAPRVPGMQANSAEALDELFKKLEEQV